MLADRNWSLDHLLQAAGWDFDRAVFVKDMAKLRKEPLSSMGHDRVLTVFSQHHPTLFKYLQQTFAEVTNPPIDPYREGGAMSLTTYLGRGPTVQGQPAVSLTGEELPVQQMELPSPVVSDAIIEEIRQNEVLGFKLLDATFPLSGGAEALARQSRRPPERRGEGSPRRLPRPVHLGQGSVQARHRFRFRRCWRSGRFTSTSAARAFANSAV